MLLDDAWAELGLEPTEDRAAVRSAYLARLLAVHPDRSEATDAVDATIALTAAYRMVDAHLSRPGAGAAHPPDGTSPPTAEVVPVALLADDTIGVGAPLAETWSIVVDAANRIGDVCFVDPSSAMLQVLVHFVGEPYCQILFTLQGRASGVTEVWCTIESLDSVPPPPIEAVTRAVLDAMVEVRSA